MSESTAPAIIVPARVTAAELAEALRRDLADVQAILSDRSEPLSQKDVIGPELTLEVAKALGMRVSIEARDLALETLYSIEANEETDIADLTGRVSRLVTGVLERKEELDHEIESASEHWSVARMPVVDRSILRLGLYELNYERDVPTAVIVSEALRLANTYSTERSGSFVNGVLASLARRVR